MSEKKSIGFGIKFSSFEDFCPIKTAKLFDITIPDDIISEEETVIWMFLMEYYNIQLLDILSRVMKESDLLLLTNQSSFEQSFYLYFPASLPWEMNNKHIFLQKKDIIDEILYVLEYILSNSTDTKTIESRIESFHTFIE